MDLETNSSYGAWSGAQIVAFLSDTQIPLRLSMNTNAGMLIVPVWFEFRAGCLFACSPNNSTLVQALRKNPQVGFDVSTNDLPYRGVRGRGTATCTVTPDSSALEHLLKRYISDSNNSFSQWLLNRRGDEAIIQVDITWLTSWDFSKRMESIPKIAVRQPDATL